MEEFIVEHHKELLTIHEYLMKRKESEQMNVNKENQKRIGENKTSSTSEIVELAGKG